MNLLRKLKINKLTPVEFTEVENTILLGIYKLLSDIKVFNDEKTHYMNGKKLVFSCDDANNLFINAREMEKLEKYLKYEDSLVLLSYMIEEHMENKYEKIIPIYEFKTSEIERKYLKSIKNNV